MEIPQYACIKTMTLSILFYFISLIENDDGTVTKRYDNENGVKEAYGSHLTLFFLYCTTTYNKHSFP